jgi:5'-nucleotidase
MNILLTNDDGIHSRGIKSLGDVLGESHNVFVVAPHEERSACSNAITVRRDLDVQTVSENRYSVTGYPADCVNIGLNGELLPEIDLVISGINHGPNLGEDVFFSGTVAGARTAMIFGVSGIALSLDCLGDSDYFDDTARFISDYIRLLRPLIGSAPFCFNINYPDIPAQEILGVKYTYLGKRNYRDSYRIVEREGGGMRLQLNGTIESPDLDGSDVSELRRGHISVTPLKLDCTDYTHLDRLPGLEALWRK